MTTSVTPVMIEATHSDQLIIAGYETHVIRIWFGDLENPEGNDDASVIAAWEPQRPDGDGWILAHKGWIDVDGEEVGAVWARKPPVITQDDDKIADTMTSAQMEEQGLVTGVFRMDHPGPDPVVKNLTSGYPRGETPCIIACNEFGQPFQEVSGTFNALNIVCQTQTHNLEVDQRVQTTPVRIIVDMSGGVFNGASATVPADVLVIDTDDPENPRANLPGYGDAIWVGNEDVDVDPDKVNAAFDGIVWL